MKKGITSLLLLMLIGCGTFPPKPKEPDKSNRIPVNKEIPAELWEGQDGTNQN